MDSFATVISIDGVGAYDLISHEPNVGGPLEDGQWRSDPPFCEVLLWQPIHIFVRRRDGRHPAHPTGGGREQGDLLFVLGQHVSLEAAQARLRVGERLMAFLDDIFAVCASNRVWAVFAIVEQEMQARAHIRMHYDKTQVWNRGGVVPDGTDEFTDAPMLVKLEVVERRYGVAFERAGKECLGSAHRSVSLRSRVSCWQWQTFWWHPYYETSPQR